MIFPDGHEPRDRGLANRYADATITDAEGRYRLPAMAGKHYLRRYKHKEDARLAPSKRSRSRRENAARRPICGSSKVG